LPPGPYVAARKLLQEHRDQLDLVAAELLQHETLDAATFKRLIGK
jgi:ATP-dependent Zn protease